MKILHVVRVAALCWSALDSVAPLEWPVSAASPDIQVHAAALLHGLSRYHSGEFKDSAESMASAEASSVAVVAKAQVEYASGRLWPAYALLMNASQCDEQLLTQQHCVGRSFVLAQIYLDLGMHDKSCDSLASILHVNRWHDSANALFSRAGCTHTNQTTIAASAVAGPSPQSSYRTRTRKLLHATNPRTAMTVACLEDHLVASSLDHGCLPVLLNLGAMMHVRGHYTQALAYYLQVLAMDPSHSLALSNCHSLWRALVNATTATNNAGRGSSSLPIYLHDGAPLDRQHQPEVPTAEEMDSMLVDAAQVHSRGHRHLALAKLKVVALHQPHNAFVLNDLGAVEYQASISILGLVDDAVESLRRALALQPNYVQALNNIATLAQGQGRDEDALGFYRHAMAVDPFDAHVRYNVGNTLMHMQRSADAVRAYVSAFSLSTYVNWTASEAVELDKAHKSSAALSDKLLRRLGAVVAAMLVAYPSPTATHCTCVQTVLTTHFDVPFGNPSALELLIRHTQKPYDRSWNVFGLALHAQGAMHDTDAIYRAIRAECGQHPVAPSDTVALSTAPPRQPLLHLIVQYYRTPDKARQDELDACLRLNLANAAIAEVHVLVESPLDLTEVVGTNPKLHVIVVQDRLTMRAALTYANQTRPHSWWVIANADIYFDSSLLSLVDGKRLRNNQVVALTRWQYEEALGQVTFQPRIDSQDAWIVHPTALPEAMLPQTDFYLGYLRSDTRFAAVLSSFNVSVVNWGFQLKAIHMHDATHRAYTPQHTAWGADEYLLLSILDD